MSMNETARILCAISREGATTEDILVKVGKTLLPTYAQVAALEHQLEAFENIGLVDLTRDGVRVTTARLTSLGAERAREAREASR